MSNTVFRTTSDPVPPIPGPEEEPNKQGAEYELEDIEPIDEREKRNGDIVLETLGINEDIKSLPEEDRGNLKEVKDYVLQVVKSRGLKENYASFQKVFREIQEDFGLEPEAEPSVILDRIGGVTKAWKSLTFVKDPADKRRIFMKMSRARSSSEMNKILFQEMENYKVWQ